MEYKGTLSVLIVSLGLFLQLCVSAPTSDDGGDAGQEESPVINYRAQHQYLVNALLQSYNPGVIPVPSAGGSLNVTVRLFLIDILDVDIERNQVEMYFNLYKEYRDEALAWDPEEFGLTKVYLHRKDVWPVDVTVQNDIGVVSNQPEQSDLVELASDGTVNWIERRRVRTLCQVYALSDRHAAQCEIKLASTDYPRHLLWLNEPTQYTANGLLFSPVSKYILVGISARKDTMNYPTESFEEMVCTIAFGRITPPEDQ